MPSPPSLLLSEASPSSLFFLSLLAHFLPQEIERERGKSTPPTHRECLRVRERARLSEAPGTGGLLRAGGPRTPNQFPPASTGHADVWGPRSVPPTSAGHPDVWAAHRGAAMVMTMHGAGG